MVELKFDCKETEDYYWKMRKNLEIDKELGIEQKKSRQPKGRIIQLFQM